MWVGIMPFNHSYTHIHWHMVTPNIPKARHPINDITPTSTWYDEHMTWYDKHMTWLNPSVGNSFLKRKIYDWQSTYQSDAIPIPIFPPSPLPGQKNSVNFMGRLAREVLRQTDPQTTTYVGK